MHLTCTVLFVSDMARMIAFYRDGLGLHYRAERSSETWAEFDAGGVTLGLHSIPSEIAQRVEISTPPEARSDTPIKLVFGAPDLEAARAHLIAHGAVMFEVTTWGTCDGLDPEGNVFQIARV